MTLAASHIRSAGVAWPVVLALAVLLIACAPMVSGAQASEPDSALASGLVLRSHPATPEDIDELRTRFGVRQADVGYNTVIEGHGTGLAPHTEAQWARLVGELMIYEVESLPSEAPSVFDLSTNPEFPAVGNQGAQGSCSAWAGTYYSYGYLEAVDNAWTGASTGDSEQLLSPAWTYNMVNNGKDLGSWIDTNMMVIRDWGTATMAAMPYDDGDYTSWGSPEAFREAPLHRGSEVGYLTYSPVSTVQAIKALVAAGTPVAFAMDANEYSAGFADGNLIISSAEYSSTTLNHAQTVVGFDDSLSDDSDSGAFRVVNSWGDEWGDSGYYWMTYAAIEELGDLELLNLNFMVDIADYEPSLLGVWHFDDPPARSAPISMSVGEVAVPENTKNPYYEGGFFSTMQVFPTFMCLDMTESAAVFWAGGGMHLSVGDTKTDGVISSFRVEGYDAPFQPGAASRLSEQSSDVPAGTPAMVSAYLDYYARIAPEDALDCATGEWTTDGQAAWVGVAHHSSGDGDSLQTGDVSDLGMSALETTVEGPLSVSFDWSVSSQSGDDSLSFYVDGDLQGQISGEVGWASKSADVGEGSHVLSWVYSKDAYASSFEDAGWLDSVSFADYEPEPEGMPVLVTLNLVSDLDYVLPGGTATFRAQVEDEEGGSITVVASYGDGSQDGTVTKDSVAPGTATWFWFNHTYAQWSDEPYVATFTAMDDDDHGTADWDYATVAVLVNTPPSAAVSADPVDASTGQPVAFDASGSSDPETAPSLLVYRWDWTGDGVWDTGWSSSPEASHSFDLPGEYEVAVQVMDGAGLSSSASASVTVTGEAIPEFSAVLVPVVATLLAIMVVRAAGRRKVQ